MIISNCTKVKKNWLSVMLTTCLKAPLCKWKSQETKTQGQEIKTYFLTNKEEICIHLKNIPNNAFTPFVISYGLDDNLLKNFFCWIDKTYQNGETNSRKQKSAQFIQKIIKRLTEHSFPSGWHDFISAFFFFYSHPDDQSCYAQQPVKTCYISKSGMLCSSFPSKSMHFNRTSELKSVLGRE